MNLHFIKTFFLSLAVMAAAEMRADHLVGGEITYTCVGENQYLVTLKIYRDCFATGASFDPNPVMTIFQGGTQYQNLSWQGFTVSTIPIVGTGPCFIDPPNLCVQVGTYERIITLPPSAQGYTIVHQRCCRGGGIINLDNPDTQGNTYFIDIPPNDSDCNSSPEFNDLPPVAICLNEPLAFDHSASEPDGDELVYSLCEIFHGGTQFNPAPNPSTPPPYTPVSWGAAFGPEDPIVSDVPFSIDSETGLLQGTPTQLGKYVIGICVSEYQNGELLCTVRRDFQLNVVPCNPVLAAAIGLGPGSQESCNGLDFQFVNDSFNAEEFQWDFGDNNGAASITNEFAPEYTYADTGTYTVMLIANPGETCADTAYLDVGAYPPVEIEIDDHGFVCEDGQQWFFETSGSFDPDVTEFTWSFGNGADPESSNVPDPSGISYSGPGFKQITVVADQFGCSDEASLSINVPLPVTAGIASQTESCQGLTIPFQHESSNATSYAWFFDDPAFPDEEINTANPTHTFSTVGTYDVMLVASANNACPDTAYQTFVVAELLDVFFDPPTSTCFEGHSFSFTAEGSFPDNGEMEWDFGENANPPSFSGSNISGVTFNSPGFYTVTLTATDGECEDMHSASVSVFEQPTANFVAGITEGCAPFEVGFTNQSEAGTAMAYQWDFGDGNTSIAANPVHTYQEAGIYTVTLNVYTNSGCIGESTKVRTEYIIVHETPRAGFAFTPDELDIFSPEVQIMDQSEGAISCYYTFPDSTVLEGCDLSWFFEEAGLHSVIQVVTDENGCQASVTNSIRVNGHLFYAPNAFSPNDDGINDIFKPVMRGVRDYQMQIINRLGEVIFTTTDQEVGWNGSGPNGTHYAEPEVFIYKARISDERGFNHDFQGHVTLVR